MVESLVDIMMLIVHFYVYTIWTDVNKVLLLLLLLLLLLQLLFLLS